MKTILRNFFSVLRRFSLAAFLNVAGLAVAFATFIIIMMTTKPCLKNWKKVNQLSY